jgi:hypothetical protein
MAAPVAGQLIRASDAFSVVSFTPTWTNVTTGAGAINEGYYQQIGRWVLWWMRLEFGTAPAYTASALMAFPVTAYASSGGTGLAATVGSWAIRSTLAINYAGSCQVNDAGGVNLKFTGAWNGTNPANNVGVSATTPVTPTAGSVLSASGSYLAV